ncbi:Crp/Fnr family transcriptional regulator [Geomonas sp. Red69]|uniref:Crp/Fnr family transcriptional regulator n=1 Tax=Geomonas diazotrophica TaxID=2843197 RepID=A0ABX8JDI0_9BACT|nr:Crp/Fnr family transcriptional regulator [Geomonas diazotrophica]QWV95833.1 Crp/Fnr family transcriptional regulator [Geomonas nitrogeniifigens]QXE84918.1 Crp/Fnr family transcriptional regulator [Geomonas nitrogeniifigens]
MTCPTSSRNKHESNIISSIPFFSSLTPDEVDQVEKLFRKKNYEKEQIVLYEEDTSSYMYLIYSGKVRVVKMNDEGKEQIITIHKKNDFFGEMSLLDNKTSPATIIAHEDSVIGLLHKSDFEQHLIRNDEIRRKIIELLCSRLRESWEMIKILSFNAENAQDRVLSLLDRLGELYGVRDDRGVIIDVKMTHQQMASYASVTRETMSRVLRSLEKSDVISILDSKAILLNKNFFDTRSNSKRH